MCCFSFFCPLVRWCYVFARALESWIRQTPTLNSGRKRRSARTTPAFGDGDSFRALGAEVLAAYPLSVVLLVLRGFRQDLRRDPLGPECVWGSLFTTMLHTYILFVCATSKGR